MVRDSRGNLPTVAQAARIERATRRIQVHMRPDRRVVTAVTNQTTQYRARVRPDTVRRFQQARALWKQAPAEWTQWYDYGFYGGYYWDLGSDFEITEYYYNPVVNYYFSGEYSQEVFDSYYRDDWETDRASEEWYAGEANESDYDVAPQSAARDYQKVYQDPFPFAGIFLPTESLRDLLMGISVMDMKSQNQFRIALKAVIEQMQAQLASQLGKGFRFQRNDVAITHYRLLDGVAIVIEGTAGKAERQFPFKALLNLQETKKSGMFIALTIKPSAADIQNLDKLNSEIDLLFHKEEQSLDYVPLEYGVDEDVSPAVTNTSASTCPVNEFIDSCNSDWQEITLASGKSMLCKVCVD
ncbi:MAG: hypothetical protein K2X47_20145 [Bdellovibrionales bacterium]|nr:hypothetical protein [Bdellovibrionales bacterium]